MKHCTVGGPAAHPERVPLHHMTRDQHTAREGREVPENERSHTQRSTEGQATTDQETNKTKNRRKGTSRRNKPTSTKKNLSMRNSATVYPTCSGLRAAGKGTNEIHG